MKQAIKNILGRVTYASRLDRVLLANSAVIVTFHRVQDTWDPTGLTVSRRTFERFCRFFSQHFRVVSLRDLVRSLERGEDLTGRLAITFDDGYRDNFENAAPILEALSLPATFFVVSRWIESEVVPWWDELQGVRHPWMTWDQVRSLHGAGFDIGAHTRTHADLGRIGARADEEIRGSRLELEDRLSTVVDLFALPYGRPDNCAEANRNRIKAAGFRCCCSCSGGVNPAGRDPFDLARVAISPWFATPFQFGFEVAWQEPRIIRSDEKIGGSAGL